jgi:predicted transport protein
MFYDEIKTNLVLEANIKNKIGSGEIYKFISDLISVKPKIIIVINEKTSELNEVTRDIRGDIKILEFKIFRRECISEEVDAYLFNPVIDFKNIEKPIVPKLEEAKKYTEEEHKKKIPEKILELYNKFKEKVLDLADGITIRPRKRYIGFVAKTNFTDVLLQKSKIKIWLNLRKGTIDDPKKFARDISNVGHWGNGDYEINISNDENLEYLISLIKQAYLKHK